MTLKDPDAIRPANAGKPIAIEQVDVREAGITRNEALEIRWFAKFLSDADKKVLGLENPKITDGQRVG